MNGVIPNLYRKAKIEELPEALGEALIGEVYSKWGERKLGPGVLLMGNNGVGKTHAVCALANDIYESGFLVKPAVYLPASALVDLWKQQDDYRDQTWDQTITRSQLVIIDDLGKELGDTDTVKQRAITRLGYVLRTRVQSGRPTFITSNFNEEGLRKEYGASIFSLFHEVAPEGCWLEVGGKDRRKKRTA